MWGSCPLRDFCQLQNSRYVQLLRSPILAALLHGTPAVDVSQTLQRGTSNGITDCIDNRKKNLLNSNTSSTCPDNMVNCGPLAAEISVPVLSTPANFNGFRVWAALLHGTLVGRQTNFAVLNRGCHLYSAGRPSPWALAPILVIIQWCRPQFWITKTTRMWANAQRATRSQTRS